MEHISSRKNQIVTHLKELSASSAYRCERGEYLCDGEKLLREAVEFGAHVALVLWGDEPSFSLPDGIIQYSCPLEIMQSVSPLKSSKGPVFSVKIPEKISGGPDSGAPKGVIVLENLQDPGNVGTVIRTANAMGCDAVILVGDCADLYNPKTVRATMGALFRQTVLAMSLDELRNYVNQFSLRLYGAALSDKAEDIRKISMDSIAVAIGSEGRGLSQEFLDVCDGQLIIPMAENSESLNAAAAATVVLWEMSRIR